MQKDCTNQKNLYNVKHQLTTKEEKENDTK